MVSLTGHGLNIIGESNVCISYDGLRHKTAVLVASDLSGDSILVAWHDLKLTEVISPNFPARISATVSKELFSDIMKEFPTVLRDKLGEFPMNVPKMKIVLAEKAIPSRVSTSRQVPLRFQRYAEKTVDDLVHLKVIIEENEPQDWCSLGFFVPQPNGEDVHKVARSTST